MSTTANKTKPTTTAPAITLERASQSTIEWWDEHAMLDGLDHQRLLAEHDQVLAVAKGLGITTVRGLHERAADVIATATGIQHIAQFATNEDREALHQVRNALSALILVSEVRHSSDPLPYDLVALLPRIAPRSGGKRRPLFDDEVLLTRCAATYSLVPGASHGLVALQYALAESGARPMETTGVTVRDFNDPFQPATVDLPGVNRMTRPRTVTLGEWASRLLRRGLDQHLGLNSGGLDLPVCWTGRSGTKSASASSSNNLKHAMERVGITAPSLEGSAITRWRVKHELHTYGEVAALKLLGQFDPLDIKVRRVYKYIDQAPPTITITPEPATRRSFKGL